MKAKASIDVVRGSNHRDGEKPVTPPDALEYIRIAIQHAQNAERLLQLARQKMERETDE